MNLKNFKISSDNITFEREGDFYDLKNCYDFVGADYQVKNKTATLEWDTNVNSTLSQHSPPNKIYLIIENVYLFSLQEIEADKPASEEDHMKSISFLWHVFFEEMGVCVSHKPGEEKTHLNIEFENGTIIKIGAASVILKTTNDKVPHQFSNTG